MKISCEKAVFQEAVLNASRGVSSKSTLQVLEGLLISATHEVTVCGYDLKTGVKCRMPASIEEEGSVVLAARILGDIIRKLPDEVVYLSCGDDCMTTISCGLSEFTLPGLPSEEFPTLPEVDQSFSFSMEEGLLKKMLAGTVFAVSDNESKPIHTGARFELTAGRLEVAAVDGFRLAVRTESVEGEAPPEEGACAFVVPGGTLKEIERMLDDSERRVTIYPDRRFILFDLGVAIVITRLLDGDFLNYKKAIPEDTSAHYVADKRELLESVERVSLIVSERLKNPIRCLFEDGVVKLSCVTALGKAYDECKLQGRASPVEIGFNYRYLLDALRACPDDQVAIDLKGSLSPCVLRPTEGDHFLYLVLPVRMKG